MRLEVITVTNDAKCYKGLRAIGKDQKKNYMLISLVIDNARYQKCNLLWQKAKELKVIIFTIMRN